MHKNIVATTICQFLSLQQQQQQPVVAEKRTSLFCFFIFFSDFCETRSLWRHFQSLTTYDDICNFSYQNLTNQNLFLWPSRSQILKKLSSFVTSVAFMYKLLFGDAWNNASKIFISDMLDHKTFIISKFGDPFLKFGNPQTGRDTRE